MVGESAADHPTLIAYRDLVQSLSAAIYVCDSAGRILFFNPAATELWGRQPVIGKDLWCGAHRIYRTDGTQMPLDQCPMAIALRDGCPCLGHEIIVERPDGTRRHVLPHPQPILNPDGQLIGAVNMLVDITERRRIETEREAALQEAKNTAEAANRAKDRFLAVLSHELRTPLTPVLMTVASMEVDPDLPETMREDVTMIRRNVELETKLIDDLLDLSRITSGKLRLCAREVDLGALVRHVCSICRPQILEKSIRLHVDVSDQPIKVSADPARLQQVLWNILKNAGKFTPDGGTISVTVGCTEPGRATVSIRDSGIGIEPHSLGRIFDAFEQGEPHTTRQFGGLGLGLAISKAIMDLHHGTLRVQSDGRGAGSTFTIELPARVEASQPHPCTKPSSDDAVMQKSRLLVVEDHVDTARTLGRLLRRAGYTVQTAGSVASALELARRECFDVIISDIGLPDATGYELMREIAQSHNIRGIAMSGYGMDEDIRKSRDAGFSDHLVKPVSFAQLEQSLQRILEVPA